MNSLERVRNTLRGLPVDHLPAQPFCMMFAAAQIGVTYAEYCRDYRHVVRGQMRMFEEFGVDALVLATDPAREMIDLVGESSVRWIDNQGPVVEESAVFLQDPGKLRGLRVPDPLGGGRMTDRIEGIRALRREVGDAASVVGWIEGPLSFASEMRGISQVMEDLLLEPVFAGDLFDFAVEVELSFARAQLDAGADTIGMGESATCLCSPTVYRELALPRQRRIFEGLRQTHPHAHLRFHCCGNTTHMLSDIGTLPADIIELDYPVDLAQARRHITRQTISGNVSTVVELLSGSPSQVYDAAAKCHSVATLPAGGGGFIVGSGCDVAPMTPPENLRALIRYAREHK
jgi:MtaA/CmuA family methyltransferase